MSERRAWLDRGVGESRAVVTLDGRPERLIIERHGEPAVQALGARLVARVRSVERAQGLAFVDLGDGPDAVLNLTGEIGRIDSGACVEIEIRAQARTGKGAQARWLGPAEGPARLLFPGPPLEARLAAWAPDARIETGAAARAMADAAQEETLETVFGLAGGGSVSIETTRALTAVDVDIGQRSGSTARQVTRTVNLAGLAAAARILRLKGLGGLVVIDLAGRGHDAPALLAAARAAFAPDNPGVAFGPVSRFGVVELTIPRRARPSVDILCGGGWGPTHTTIAMNLIRALEREAVADGGGRFEGLAAPPVAAAAAAALAALVDRLGARLSICPEPGRKGFEIVRR
ncbi:MAG TPA: ribonuclease E/G [Caulobacteraceae bacterium]|jgi:Ribonuclease G/E